MAAHGSASLPTTSNLDSSQFALSVFGGGDAAAASAAAAAAAASPPPRQRPLRKAAELLRPLSPAPAPFSPSLASPAARNRLAPVLGALQLQSAQLAAQAQTQAQAQAQAQTQMQTQQALFPPPLPAADEAPLPESVLAAVGRAVAARMHVEVQAREGLARELARMREAVFGAELQAREAVAETDRLRQRQGIMQAELAAVAEAAREARQLAAAAGSGAAGVGGSGGGGSSSGAASARSLAGVAEDVAALGEHVRALRAEAARSAARADALQRALEAQRAEGGAAAGATSDGRDAQIEGLLRHVQAQLRDLSVRADEETRQRIAAEEALGLRVAAVVRTLADAPPLARGGGGGGGGGGPLSPSASHGLVDRRVMLRVDAGVASDSLHGGGAGALSPGRFRAAPGSAEEAMRDASDDDPSLWSNRVVTRAVLETFLSGLRAAIEAERETRRRDLVRQEADFTLKLDRLVAEVSSFRELVPHEVRARVDAVVEAVTGAIAELATKSATLSAQGSQLGAALQEERAWARDNAALMREALAQRCGAIEQAVRVQARSRMATEQALGDALLRGLQQEQGAREAGVSAALARAQDVARALDALGQRVERVEGDFGGSAGALRGLEVRARALEEGLPAGLAALDERARRDEATAQASMQHLDERCRKLEDDLVGAASGLGERMRKLDADVAAASQLARSAEERADAEARVAQEGRRSLELALSLVGSASEARAQAVEREARAAVAAAAERAERFEAGLRAQQAAAGADEAQRLASLEAALAATEAARRAGESSIRALIASTAKRTAAEAAAQLQAWSETKEADLGGWQEGLAADVQRGVAKIEAEVQRVTERINRRVGELAVAINSSAAAAEAARDAAADAAESARAQQQLEQSKAAATAQPKLLPPRDVLAPSAPAPAAPSASRPESEAEAAVRIQAIARGRAVRNDVAARKAGIGETVAAAAESVSRPPVLEGAALAAVPANERSAGAIPATASAIESAAEAHDAAADASAPPPAEPEPPGAEVAAEHAAPPPVVPQGGEPAAGDASAAMQLGGEVEVAAAAGDAAAGSAAATAEAADAPASIAAADAAANAAAREHAASVKIQAVQRGNRARKDVAAERRSRAIGAIAGSGSDNGEEEANTAAELSAAAAELAASAQAPASASS